MSTRMIKAILDAYTIAKPHLVEELPGEMPVVLLVRFTLADLWDLDRQHPRDVAAPSSK